MALLRRIALATGLSIISASSASSQDVIEQNGYANNVADYLTENCPKKAEDAEKPENVVSCLDATLTATYQIAADLSDFITEVKAPTMPFRSGISNGDLLISCEAPANAIDEREFSSLIAHQTAIADFARACISSIRRSAANIGLAWEEVAVNTVANHVNCLTGNNCISGLLSGDPVRVEIAPVR